MTAPKALLLATHRESSVRDSRWSLLAALGRAGRCWSLGRPLGAARPRRAADGEAERVGQALGSLLPTAAFVPGPASPERTDGLRDMSGCAPHSPALAFAPRCGRISFPPWKSDSASLCFLGLCGAALLDPTSQGWLHIGRAQLRRGVCPASLGPCESLGPPPAELRRQFLPDTSPWDPEQVSHSLVAPGTQAHTEDAGVPPSLLEWTGREAASASDPPQETRTRVPEGVGGPPC